MRKLNILFVFHVPFIAQNGGVERVTDILSRHLINRGYSVFYLSSEQRCSNFDFPVKQFYFPTSIYYSQKNIDYYNSFLLENKIDIVINQNGSEQAAFLYLNIKNRSNVKIISVIHTNPLVGFRHHQYALIPLWVSFSLRDVCEYLMKLLLFPLRYIYRTLAQLHKLKSQYSYVTQNSDVVLLLSNNYIKDMSYICPSSVFKLRSIPNPLPYSGNTLYCKKKQILYVGRFGVTEKRPDRLLKIWKRIYKQYLDWELIFVGYGGLERYMRNYVKRHKLERILFAGQCDPRIYYESSAILCLTSSYEGFPMVLLEAMQHKVIPMAFDSFASVRDIIIPRETGLLVTPFNLNEYANQLAELMSNPSQRLKLAEQAYSFVQKFSASNVVSKWEDLFVEIMDKG